MAQDDFAALEAILQSENPSGSFDFLIARFRDAKDYRSLFEARLAKKRLELGLPLLQTDPSSFPSEVGDPYRQAVTETAREVGELFLSDGQISSAWPYFRATGDVARMAAAIEKADLSVGGEEADRIIEIALTEAVHPSKGLQLVIDKYGMCDAIGAFGMSAVEKDREKCIGVLARQMHSEVVERLGAAIEGVEGKRPDSRNIPEIVAERGWLFGAFNTYVDISHLVSLLQYCPEVTAPETLRVFHELCEYGKRLSPEMKVQGQPPFEDVYVDYDHYIQALLGVDVETHVGHFHRKAVQADPERAGTIPAQVLVRLLVRLDRLHEALEVALKYFPQARPTELTCATATELCELAGDFDRLKDLARERGDLLSYAAAALTQLPNYPIAQLPNSRH